MAVSVAVWHFMFLPWVCHSPLLLHLLYLSLHMFAVISIFFPLAIFVIVLVVFWPSTNRKLRKLIEHDRFFLLAQEDNNSDDDASINNNNSNNNNNNNNDDNMMPPLLHARRLLVTVEVNYNDC